MKIKYQESDPECTSYLPTAYFLSLVTFHFNELLSINIFEKNTYTHELNLSDIINLFTVWISTKAIVKSKYRFSFLL